VEWQQQSQTQLQNLRQSRACAGSVPTKTKRSKKAKANAAWQMAEPTPLRQEMDDHVQEAGKAPGRAGEPSPSVLRPDTPGRGQKGIPQSKTGFAARRFSHTSSSKGALTGSARLPKLRARAPIPTRDLLIRAVGS